MKRFLGALVLALLMNAVWAGFEEGSAAYEKKDFPAALGEWRPLAEADDSRAQYRLGLMHENASGLPQDDKEAARWYRLAAGQGHAEAQYRLWVMYYQGQGVAQDEQEALRWLRLAVDQGLAIARNDLAGMHAAGLLVARDDQEAVRGYRLAAEQGLALAQYNLGLMYASGQGVSQDEKQAGHWFSLAADQGFAVAQNDLGAMYANGLGGLPENRVVAYALCQLSADNEPSRDATINLFKLTRKLDPDQIETARKLSHEMAQGKPGEVIERYLRTAPTGQAAKQESPD